MKIRIMGTHAELELAKAYYLSLQSSPNVNWVDISSFYANRNSNVLYRLYVEISYKSMDIDTAQIERGTL